MCTPTVFNFVYHCALAQRERMSTLDYEAYLVDQIKACRRLCNWEAIEVLQGLLCDAVMAKYS